MCQYRYILEEAAPVIDVLKTDIRFSAARTAHPAPVDNDSYQIRTAGQVDQKYNSPVCSRGIDETLPP